MKNVRHEVLLEIIQSHHVNTQEDLKHLMQQAGFPVTQATISRDIKALNLIKKADSSGKYYYQKNEIDPDKNDLDANLLANHIQNIDFAGHTVVIKCTPGTAQAVCTVMDKRKIPEIVGTLAGEDTIFMTIRTPVQARCLAEKLNKKFQKKS